MKQIIFFILIAATFGTYSCDFKDKKQFIFASQPTLIDTLSASCPYLTQDATGNSVLSWIKQVDSSTNIYCYAISQDQGKTFGKAIEIPGSTNVHPHGENMPKVVFKPSGEIIAVWGASNPNRKNAYAGMVYYAQSFDGGKSWNQPVKLVKDTAGFDQRYFDLALLPNGEVAIVWLDNRKDVANEGSGLYYAVTNGSTGFIKEQLIASPCCQCCRTKLFVDRKENIHVLYRAIIQDSIRDMAHIISTDGGASFSNPQLISRDNWVINGCPHTGPSMTENKNGIQLTWFTAGGGPGIYYCNSKDDGNSFTSRELISGGSVRHCQITALSNNNIVIVWNENLSVPSISSSRIGLEIKDADGRKLAQTFISSENGAASFPVVNAVDANTALVAYTENVKGKDYVMYKLVKFTN